MLLRRLHLEAQTDGREPRNECNKRLLNRASDIVTRSIPSKKSFLLILRHS